MKNVRLIKNPNLICSSLIILTSFIFLSCGPEKEEYVPEEHEDDISISTIVSSAMCLNEEMCSLQNYEFHFL